jgi:hypothetical protein
MVADSSGVGVSVSQAARICDASVVSDEQWVYPVAQPSLLPRLRLLESGPSFRFSDWPNESVPKIAAGVYTIWDSRRLTYVGMAGRGLAADDLDAPDEPVKARGLWTRLNSHASGRRSGDQFCVYVCDRFVVPHLSVQQQAQIAEGELALDALTRTLIHDRYEYRFVTTPDGAAALVLEREVRHGALRAGKPFLNPA